MIFSRKKKIPKPVSDDNEELERCVLCHELTDVKKNTSTEKRTNYEAGIGQLCARCANKVHMIDWQKINR